MKKYIIFLILLNTILSFSQEKKDTLYVRYDCSYPEMRKANSFFTHPNMTSKDSLTFSYNIDFIEKGKPSVLLTHYIIAGFVKERALDTGGYSYPLRKRVETSYLKDKQILDIHFFREKPFKELEKLFQGNDLRSLDDNPFVWLYDVNEIKDGKVLLREVKHIRHQYE